MTLQDPPAQPRSTARAFWTGPKLSPYEELSLLSFVATGARVLLYSPDRSLQVPPGVELVDVRELLSQPVHKYVYDDGDPCLTVHSDLFRYHAVNAYGGWYFDLDIVANRASLPDTAFYIAREDERLVNAAVMKFPAGSLFTQRAMKEATALLPKAGRLDIGPDLVTRLITELDLNDVVQPRSRAYEVRTTEVLSLFDPADREALDERTADSDFVHLWNEIWRRIRIPKNYGPPEGSFLDGLFKRHGISFSAEGRLSLESLRHWIGERNLSASRAGAAKPSVCRSDPSIAGQHRVTKSPQMVRTFWHGTSIGPYQQMCLKSFADRGHTVEVFSYEPMPGLPKWLTRRDAHQIVDADRILQYLPDHEGFAIHANLFRYALLEKLGGWWVDPDVVLTSIDMPEGNTFLADDAGVGIATAAIKVPPAHPAVIDASRHCHAVAKDLTTWDATGSPLLLSKVKAHGLVQAVQPASLVSPLGIRDVLPLFDPSQTQELAHNTARSPFFDLHSDVWYRAGVPDYLGPPEGSYLDALFRKHDVGFQFATRMHFSDVRRWFSHMYAANPPA